MDIDYIFDTEHPFFREIVVFTTAIIATIALLNIGRQREAMEQFKAMLRCQGNIREVKFPPLMQDSIRIPGRVVDSIFLNVREITLAIQNSTQVSCVRCEVADATPVLSRSQSKQLGGHHLPGNIVHQAAQVAAGSAYETIKDKVEAAYGRDPVSWPKVVEYFRHIRNGCFHNNRFNIQAPRGRTSSINTSNPPKWRTSIMLDDASMNSRWVFGDFLDGGDCPILLADVANQLKHDAVIP